MPSYRFSSGYDMVGRPPRFTDLSYPDNVRAAYRALFATFGANRRRCVNIIRHRLGLIDGRSWSLAEIADVTRHRYHPELCVSTERARQLESTGLRMMRWSGRTRLMMPIWTYWETWPSTPEYDPAPWLLYRTPVKMFPIWVPGTPSEPPLPYQCANGCAHIAEVWCWCACHQTLEGTAWSRITNDKLGYEI